jgi:hypothetical protein
VVIEKPTLYTQISGDVVNTTFSICTFFTDLYDVATVARIRIDVYDTHTFIENSADKLCSYLGYHVHATTERPLTLFRKSEKSAAK